MIQRDAHRPLTIFLGLWSLTTSASAAVLFNRLPGDPLHVGRHLVTYNAFTCALAVLGIVGAMKRNATLTTIFGNYLFLDILVCTLPRLITLSFLPAFRDQICSVDSIYAWLQSQTASETLLISDRGLMAQDLLSQCGDVVVVLQVVMVLWLLLATAVHVVLAIRVGRFARYLREEDVKAGERKLVVWQKKQAMATKEPEEEVLKKRIDMV